MSAMETITCHHKGCGHTWTPRVKKPKRCPQCQNPLWKSEKPKRKLSPKIENHHGIEKISTAPSETAAVVPQEPITVTLDSHGDVSGVVVSIPAKGHYEVPAEMEYDPIKAARERAEELLRRLNAPND